MKEKVRKIAKMMMRGRGEIIERRMRGEKKKEYGDNANRRR